MHRTRVGYAGGTSAHPTYHRIGDHAECLQLAFDPEVLSYSKLLKLFASWHNPFRPAWARQYMSAILYHDEQQKKAVEAWAAGLERVVATEIQPYQGFTLAEDYHQKYYLRKNHRVTREFERMFSDLEEFVDSYAVTRANAALGGYYRLTEKEVSTFGLSDEAASSLLRKKKSLLGILSGLLPI